MPEYPECVLVVGGGGRECALACALLECPRLKRLIITPANWGVLDPLGGSGGGSRVKAANVGAEDIDGLTRLCRAEGVELAVIGPEGPLCLGVADELRAIGVAVFGPGAKASRLEGSKAYAKDFMLRHGIPTAESKVFGDYAALCAYIEEKDGPLVLKADGLAAGKGVLICLAQEEALAAAARLMEAREFGAAGDRVIVEEMLTGREISFTCIVGTSLSGVPEGQLVATSTDYKRIRDGDEGPNTGGMGNICPSPYATTNVVAEFLERIWAPFLAGLEADRLEYRGFLFIGAMLTDAGLKVLEFNTRLGDPEAEVVLPLAQADWCDLMLRMARGEPMPGRVVRRPGACCAVMLASAGYPVSKSAPEPIEGLDRLAARGLLAGEHPALRAYFCGVAREPLPGPGEPYRNYTDELAAVRYLAAGGRVLCLSALGRDLSEARRLAYEAVGNVRFAGMQFRSDIGQLR